MKRLLRLSAAVWCLIFVGSILISPAIARFDWNISPWVEEKTTLPTLIMEGYRVISASVFRNEPGEGSGQEIEADADEAADQETDEGGGPAVETALYEIIYLTKGGRLYRCITLLNGSSHRCEYTTFAVIGDKMAEQALENAYEASQIFFMYNPDAVVELEDLLKNGLEKPEEVQIEVLNQNKRKLQISASHERGSKIFFVNATGVISEASK